METKTQAPVAPAGEGERNSRKSLVGHILSDRMDKTRVVRMIRRVRHRAYGKILTRQTKVHAHDEKNETHIGDRVLLMSTRPLSKTKRWRIVKILEKAPVSVSTVQKEAKEK